MKAQPRAESLASAKVPRVDVRVVLFSVSRGRLWVALNQSRAVPGLPRVRLEPGVSLDMAATRILGAHLAVAERYIEQLYSMAHGEGADWTVAVSYLGLAAADDAGPPAIAGVWWDAVNLPEMDEKDRMIVDYALLRLRAKLGYTTIAFHLLPLCFSLSDLQQVYEAVLDRGLDKRNFRRRVHAEGFLEATGATRREGSHRPARLYRFRAAHAAETYLTPPWAESGEPGGAG